jgi:predicted TIM-barrel fold metal-dependent hydrolase
VFGIRKGVARHDTTYGEATTQLRHIGCTLFVVVIAMLPLADAQAQTQTHVGTEGYRSLLQQLHDDPVRASSMERGTLRAQHPYIRSVLDPYNLPASAYEAGKRSGLFILDHAGEPTGPTFEPYRDGNIDFIRPVGPDGKRRQGVGTDAKRER